MARVLVTGGAGFIGSHTVDALVDLGHDVVVLDNLDPDVHGPQPRRPAGLHPAARLVQADVRDGATLGSLVEGADVVFHLAACTGVGQSMYQPRRYVEVNVAGTAALLEALQRARHRVRRVVVASSRAVYGEGAYHCDACGPVTPQARARTRLEAGDWEPPCPACGGPAAAVATGEAATLCPGSVYGVTKLAQEQACLSVGAAYGIPVVALRYFNVFGPGQSLRNPYTGVLTAFFNCIRSGAAPEVYEDGLESRDFVHVADVVRANLLAMERDEVVGRAVNVGSGERVTLMDVARGMAGLMDGSPPVVSGRFRLGDVRHCFADLGLARRVLGQQAAIPFADGLADVVGGLAGDSADDRSAVALEELQARGLSAKARR